MTYLKRPFRAIRSLLAILVISVASNVAVAADRPVVVELFTSQGCSSCPPADAYMHELAARDDVVALAYHVDYWDYIGWKDVFGQKRFSKRQSKYVMQFDDHQRYTPQMIIGGRQSVVGSSHHRVERVIQSHKPEADLAISKTDAAYHIRISATGLPKGDVVLATLLVDQSVPITRGENRGHVLRYTNIVEDLKPIASWNGEAAELSLVLSPEAGKRYVVLLQETGQKRIFAARYLHP
ncbi:MAG: DUF1223 domain-containing protein [Halocynthiibacter sp.]